MFSIVGSFVSFLYNYSLTIPYILLRHLIFLGWCFRGRQSSPSVFFLSFSVILWGEGGVERSGGVLEQLFEILVPLYFFVFLCLYRALVVCGLCPVVNCKLK